MSETIFTYAAPGLKFGPGAAQEIGFDLARQGVRRVLLITDEGLVAAGHPQAITKSLATAGIWCDTYSSTGVEPTDASMEHAIGWAREQALPDAIIAVGGGSTIDTAKAVNLLLTNTGELMDYINQPIGSGLAPTNPLLPLVAVPTTTGTGSESTTICVLDVLALKVKTGISHAALRPMMAVVDPLLTLSQPAEVTACSGLDVLCHALESYTARGYRSFEAKQPGQRVPYCGANPIADVWSERALELVAQALRGAVRDGSDVLNRENMALAATFAGLGFGNAGVHIPHANAYPIAGQVPAFHAAGYPGDEPLVPHGMAVSLTAPEAFRFTYSANPERHVRAAALLDPGHVHHSPDQGRDALANVVTALMHDIGMPNGLGTVGFDSAQVPDLVAGSAKQTRLLSTAPCPVHDDDLAGIFEGSFTLW